MEPNELLIKAVPFARNKKALDLGSGALRDSNYLASHGFNVLAIDSCQELLKLPKAKNVSVIVSSYKNYFADNKDKFGIINAQWSLSFCPKDDFRHLIESIKKSLILGGVFVGNLFGVNDEWNDEQVKALFFSKEEAQSFFEGMEIIYFADIEENKKSAVGQMKHWHHFDFIVRP